MILASHTRKVVEVVGTFALSQIKINRLDSFRRTGVKSQMQGWAFLSFIVTEYERELRPNAVTESAVVTVVIPQTHARCVRNPIISVIF